MIKLKAQRVSEKHSKGDWLLLKYIFVSLLLLFLFTGTLSFSFNGFLLILFSFVLAIVLNLFILPRVSVLKPLYYKLSIKEKIANVFLTNNLFISEVVRKDGKKKESIIYFPICYFEDRGDSFVVSIRLDGSKYQDKFLDLEDKFSYLFVLPLTNKKVEKGYVVYEFSKQRDRGYVVDSSIEGGKFNFEKGIPLSSGLNWDFNKYPHGIVAGQTGKGKTYFLFYLIRNMLALGGTIKIIDAKMSDLAYLDKYFGKDVVSSKGHIMRLLRETTEKMNERFKEMKSSSKFKVGQNYVYYGMNPIFLVFDEFVAFAGTLDTKEKKEMNGYLLELILKGRQAGVFVILATQRPDAEFLSGNIRDQLGLRVALGGMSTDGYGMVFGNSSRDLIPRGQGEGYIYLDGQMTVPREFDAPYLEKDYDFIRDIERLINYSAV